MRALVVVMLLSLCACKLPQNRQSCPYLCQHDAACQQALAAEGIAPMGMTQSDPALCNGICSSLRTMAREHGRQRGDLGVDPKDAPWRHPCMPGASK